MAETGTAASLSIAMLIGVPEVHVIHRDPNHLGAAEP